MNGNKDLIKKDFAAAEKELNVLYDLCKEQNLSSEEMKFLLEPLRKIIFKNWLSRNFRRMFILLIVILVLYSIVQIDTVAWHLSAVGRIGMIYILPYWNWEKLMNEKCLFYGHKTEDNVKHFDCTLCESIDSIAVEKNIDPELLSDVYLDINVPVLLSDGLKSWPVYDMVNLTQIILTNDILSKSYPCELSTNMLSSTRDVSQILKRTYKFNKWFLHFQNCEMDAVKAFRVLTPRPQFLKPEISPIQYSWLLMSKNYKFPDYKTITLKEKITVIGQIIGSNYVRLIPRKNCYKKCPIIELNLQKNEVLVFGNLWDLKYKPSDDDEVNIAIILEAN